MEFFIFTLVVVVLGIVIAKYWEFFFFLGLGTMLILGILASSWTTAFVLTFFNLFLTEKWEGFYTRWLYSGVFFTVATFVYMVIVYDILDYGIGFVKSLFRSR